MTARRVAIVTTSFPRHAGDPSGHFVETEARARVRAGDDVTVLAPGPLAPLAGDDAPRVQALPGGAAFGWPGALTRLREHPPRALHALAWAVATRRALARLAPDEVVAHWVVPCAVPIALGTSAATTAVAHGSDVGVLERLPRPVAGAILATLAADGARLRVVSEDLAARLRRLALPGALPELSVELAPLGVAGAPGREEARVDLGISPGERLAVIVGRLVESKRPARAVELARRAGATTIVVVGDGPLRAALDRRGVLLVGQLPRPRALAWIAAADLLVSASREEGAPSVVREARALGVPVLAVAAGDLERWAEQDPGITLLRE